MEKIILKYSDNSVEEILNTDKKISFINIVTKLSDQLLIENHFAQSGCVLREYYSSKELVDVDIIVMGENGEETINFNKKIGDVFYYYEFDSIRNKMREYIKIEFIMEV